VLLVLVHAFLLYLLHFLLVFLYVFGHAITYLIVLYL
jgi:hypothetical protein